MPPLGLNTVWKNYYLQGLHQAIDIGDIYVNLDWWNKLPKDLQAIFQTGIMALITDTYNWNVSQNSKALKKFVVEDKVQVRDTPPTYSRLTWRPPKRSWKNTPNRIPSLPRYTSRWSIGPI